jgi:hypothetical protein
LDENYRGDGGSDRCLDILIGLGNKKEIYPDSGRETETYSSGSRIRFYG